MTDIDDLVSKAEEWIAIAEEGSKPIVAQTYRVLVSALTTEREKVAALEAEVKIAEAKGWRDAVTCVQYCEANWYQDCRSAEERKALESAAHELVNELVTCSPGEWLGTEWKTAQDYTAIIAKLEAKAVADATRIAELEAACAANLGIGDTRLEMANAAIWELVSQRDAAKADAARWRAVAKELAEALGLYWTDVGCDCADCQKNRAALDRAINLDIESDRRKGVTP